VRWGGAPPVSRDHAFPRGPRNTAVANQPPFTSILIHSLPSAPPAPCPPATVSLELQQPVPLYFLARPILPWRLAPESNPNAQRTLTRPSSRRAPTPSHAVLQSFPARRPLSDHNFFLLPIPFPMLPPPWSVCEAQGSLCTTAWSSVIPWNQSNSHERQTTIWLQSPSGRQRRQAQISAVTRLWIPISKVPMAGHVCTTRGGSDRGAESNRESLSARQPVGQCRKRCELL